MHIIPIIQAPDYNAFRSILNDQLPDTYPEWVKNHTETPFRSGPTDDSVLFTRLPQWTTLKQIESRPDWLLVQYAGDGDTRQAGPGWVRARARAQHLLRMR